MKMIKRLKIMRKIIVLTALIVSALSSCSKEGATANNGKECDINKSAIVIGVATENIADVKSKYNSSWEVSWEATDKIGLVVSNSTNSWYTNQECTTTGSGTNVTFTSTTSYNEVDKWNIAAFYPWNGSGSDVNNWYSSDDNAYNGVMYFKLPSSYSGYTNGKNYMPMLANLTGDETHPTKMSFKHVGAGVHVKITDLPKGAHSIGMEVDDVQLWGDFDPISAGDAGSSSLSGKGNDADNADQVWLNFDPSTEGSMDFIFPVPPLNTPTLSFKIYDKNDVCIWSRTASGQNSVGRAQILDMPELSIASSLYVVYIKDDTNWGEGTRYLFGYNSNEDIKAWPGLESSGTETISGITYQKFLLPKSVEGTQYFLIYNNNNNNQVNLPDITFESSAKKNYICTDGSATSVVLTAPDKDIAISQKVIDVGVISYLYNEEGWNMNNVKLHYWGENSVNGDVIVIQTGTTESKSLGSSYWGNVAQTFQMGKATIPNDITGFKVHYGDRWFGGDAASNIKIAYIFNYGGDQALYE